MIRRRTHALGACLLLCIVTAAPGHAGSQEEPEPAKPAGRPVVRIRSKIDDDRWRVRPAIHPMKGQRVSLRIKRLQGATVRWYEIRPKLDVMYKNANHPWEKNAYKWVGYGKIDYARKELKQFRDQWEIQPLGTGTAEPAGATEGERPGVSAGKALAFRLKDALSGRARKPGTDSYYRPDVGTFRFQAVVQHDGKTYRSHGMEDSDHRGLHPKVFRISVREDESYLGYLTSYFNVPAVFGSVPYQSMNYIGVDCADVLMAAHAKWKDRKLARNYNVAYLVANLPTVAEFEVQHGAPSDEVTWNKQIRGGDFIAVRYSGAKSYQHIGALYRDADEDGILDKDDIVLHAGPYPLHTTPLGKGKFDGHVKILRVD